MTSAITSASGSCKGPRICKACLAATSQLHIATCNSHAELVAEHVHRKAHDVVIAPSQSAHPSTCRPLNAVRSSLAKAFACVNVCLDLGGVQLSQADLCGVAESCLPCGVTWPRRTQRNTCIMMHLRFRAPLHRLTHVHSTSAKSQFRELLLRHRATSIRMLDLRQLMRAAKSVGYSLLVTLPSEPCCARCII